MSEFNKILFKLNSNKYVNYEGKINIQIANNQHSRK